VLAIWCGWVRVVTMLQADTTQTQPHQIANTTKREQNNRCGNSTAQLQAPDDGYINV